MQNAVSIWLIEYERTWEWIFQKYVEAFDQDHEEEDRLFGRLMRQHYLPKILRDTTRHARNVQGLATRLLSGEFTPDQVKRFPLPKFERVAILYQLEFFNSY